MSSRNPRTHAGGSPTGCPECAAYLRRERDAEPPPPTRQEVLATQLRLAVTRAAVDSRLDGRRPVEPWTVTVGWHTLREYLDLTDPYHRTGD